MPEKLIGGYALSDALSWAKTLTTAIKTGTYKSAASGWLKGIDVTDPKTSSMAWATDANAYVCTTVLKGGISAVENKECDGAYYTDSIPVIKTQIAKGAFILGLVALRVLWFVMREMNEC
jgi:S1/P1 Nuclease